MAVDLRTLQEILAKQFPNAQIAVTDLAGDGDHYAVDITDAGFAGKTRVVQHRMVYQALQAEMGSKVGDKLHALALTTRTP